MLYRTLVFVFVGLFPLIGFCQKSKSDSVRSNQQSLNVTNIERKIKYGGTQQLGLIFSESTFHYGFNFFNGLRYKRHFSGIGIQYEGLPRNNYTIGNFQFSTASLYAGHRYYLNKRKNFFAKAEAGTTMIASKFTNNNFQKFKKFNGAYGAIGIGFKAKLSSEVFYSFDLNYNLRNIRFNHEYNSSWNGRGWIIEKYDSRQYRLMLNIGLEFF